MCGVAEGWVVEECGVSCDGFCGAESVEDCADWESCFVCECGEWYAAVFAEA